MYNTSKLNILKVLPSNGELFGSEIRERTEINRGDIYVILNKMENEGLIVSRPNAEGRRSYSMTDKGLFVLQQSGYGESGSFPDTTGW